VGGREEEELVGKEEEKRTNFLFYISYVPALCRKPPLHIN
jgi:hypothetical protein